MADNKTTKGTIGASIGITKNLGNYESLKLDARADAEVEDIHDPEAWQEVWDEIEAQLEAKVTEANEDLD